MNDILSTAIYNEMMVKAEEVLNNQATKQLETYGVEQTPEQRDMGMYMYHTLCQIISGKVKFAEIETEYNIKSHLMLGLEKQLGVIESRDFALLAIGKVKGQISTMFDECVQEEFSKLCQATFDIYYPNKTENTNLGGPTMYEITFKIESVVATNSNCPTLKIEAFDESGQRINKGYLTPFRGYCFQVSGTDQGEGDKGSSDVIGLGNIIRAFNNYEQPAGAVYRCNYCGPKGMVESIFHTYALTAATRFERDFNLNAPQQEIFNKFIEDSINWVKGFMMTNPVKYETPADEVGKGL